MRMQAIYSGRQTRYRWRRSWDDGDEMRGHFGRSVFTAFLLSVASLPAGAQPDGAEIFSELLACDPMTDPTQRLACYDAVLKQYKVRFGLLEGRAEEFAAQRPPTAPVRQQQPRRPAVPPAQVSQVPLDDLSGRPDGGRAARSSPSRPTSSQAMEQPASPSDLDLPYETRITGYNANARGDFRLQIAEGFIFQDADGPGFSEDPTGKTVTLTKNFFGNWRIEVPGEGQLVWVKPLDREGGAEERPRRRTTASQSSPPRESDSGSAASSGAPRQAASSTSPGPAQHPADLDLPHETRITGYNANARGDFRLRIAEGFIFEDADGPGFSEDPTGKTVTLTKNFFGNWRIEVPGEGQRVWVKPVSGS